MDDRVSRYPGRVKLTPVEGQENVYDMVLADEPITVGTRLNKANLLSDQVATLIGLNTSAVPDDMFNVLATAGDLHVWRRTTEKGESGFNLGQTEKLIMRDSGKGTMSLEVYSDIKISKDGKTITPVGGSIFNSSGLFVLPHIEAGKYAFIGRNSFTPNTWYKIPSGSSPYGTEYTSDEQGYTKAQKILPYAAGTTVDYPVSTNENAYQTGIDAKPAGYTLRPAEKYTLTGAGGLSRSAYYSDSITVNEDGTINLPDDKVYTTFHYESASEHNSKLRNKFVQFSNSKGAIYIPSDAVFSAEGSPKGEVVDKAQIVDSYAAIPAGTTIEYLGKLGDKARIVTGSYVGSGTYGSGNKNKLSFPFTPKIVFLSLPSYASGSSFAQSSINAIPWGFTEKTIGLGDSYSGKESNTLTFSENEMTWYSGSATGQLNESGRKYFYMAIS